MPCKRLQPSYRPSANSLTLVPTRTTEYIAAGDSQAAVPFPTEIGRNFDLQWKTTSGLSYLLLQLVVTAGKRAFQRRALRRPHPARREVTCGDTDMDWPRLGAVLHTTGLWGRSYLGVGRVRCGGGDNTRGGQRNHAHTDETASWKRRDHLWFALLEFALLVEVPRGIADERDSADRTVTPTRNKTKMKGFVEMSTLLIHSAPKQKSNEWMHLSPFYTRMHGESTGQFHCRFLFSQRWSGLPSKSPYVVTT